MYKDCYKTQYEIGKLIAGILIDNQGDMGVTDFDGVATVLSKWMYLNGFGLERYEMDDDYIDGLRKELREDAESGFAGDERLTEKQAEDWEWQTRTDPDWRKGEVVGLNIKDLIMPPVKLNRCPEDIL